ncbi:MAG TPA: PIN domain-containing protein, partial [Puia sp.]
EFVAKAEIVLSKLYELSIKYIPSIKLSVIADEPDNRMLELAVTAQADYIVTGNTKDFTFSQYEGVKIVTPEQLVGLVTT